MSISTEKSKEAKIISVMKEFDVLIKYGITPGENEIKKVQEIYGLTEKEALDILALVLQGPESPKP